MRVVATASRAHGCVVHYSTSKVEGKKTGEVSLVREKHKEFEKDDIVCDSIEEPIVELLKPKFDKARFTRKEWSALPKRILDRMIRYRVTGCDTPLTIVTTLTDRQRFSAADIAELYGLRWDVEVDIRSYKSTMGMCELRCLTPDA